MDDLLRDCLESRNKRDLTVLLRNNTRTTLNSCLIFFFFVCFRVFSWLKILKNDFPNSLLKHFPFSIFRFPFLYLVGLFIFSIAAFAQNLPKEIRGYKVYQARISVQNAAEKNGARDKSAAFVKVGEPELVDVSLTGITFEISAEIDSIEQSGTIDFLTFHDFRVNGLQVDVEEYRESFEFKKNRLITLPKPVKIFVGAGQTLRGALKEMRESKNEWTVTGRIFVFGQFKKSFLKFKRVVPVEINLKIKNPLRDSQTIRSLENLSLLLL